MGSNVQLIHNTKQLNVFSSNIDQRAFTSSDYFNYTDSVNNPGTIAGEPHKKTLLGDAFLGYKYYFMADYQKDNNPHVSGNEIITLDGNETQTDWGVKYSSYGIYENIYALPLCFYTTSETPLVMEGKDYFVDMQNLFKFLGGQGELFINKPINAIGGGTYTVNKDVISITPYKSIEGEYFIHFNFEDDIPIIETYGGRDMPINYKRYGKLGYTTSQSSGSWQTVTIKRTGRLAEMTDNDLKLYLNEKLSIKIVDKNALLTLANVAKNKIIKFSETRDGIKFNLNTASMPKNDNEQVYVYLANNYLDGSYLKINGKKVNPISNPTGLTIFKLGEIGNSYSVKTGYVSKYPIISIIVALVSAGLIIGLTILRRKTKFLDNAIVQEVLYYSNVLLAIGILAFFFIYPITLTIDKFMFKVDLWKIISPK